MFLLPYFRMMHWYMYSKESGHANPSLCLLYVLSNLPHSVQHFLHFKCINGKPSTQVFFLALLDYVSRAHEIEIRPSVVRRPSYRRPSSVCGIDYL